MGMHLQVTRGSLSGALSLLGAGVAFVAPPDAKFVGFLLIAAGIIAFLFDVRIMDGHAEYSKLRRTRRMIPLIGMVLSGALFAGFVAWYLWPATPQHLPPPVPPKNLYLPTPLTLKNLFETDFEKEGGSWLSYSQFKQYDLGFVTDPPTRVLVRIINNFEAKSRFAAVYLDDQHHQADALAWVADQMSNIIHSVDAELVPVGVGNPGDSQTITTTDLTFSGLVYAYTETDMSAHQIAALQDLYGRKQMTIQVRGRFYQASHQFEQRQIYPGFSVRPKK